MDYVLSLILVCAVSFVLAVYAWTRRPIRPTTRAYAAVALTKGLWTLYFALDPIIPALPQKLILDHLAWLFAFVLELALLRFALIYVGQRWSRRTWLLISAIAALFVLASFTNEAFHLMYSSVWIVAGAPYAYLEVQYTPIAWAAYLYGYGLIAIAVLLLLRHYADSAAPYRVHTAIIIAGVAIPVAFSIIGIILDQTTGEPVGSAAGSEALALVYALGTVLMAIGVFRVRVFQVSPIAHQFVFDRLSDAVIVTDIDGQIADFNPAARVFAAPGLTQIAGRSIEEAFPQFTDELTGFVDDGEIDRRFVSEIDGRRQHFDLTIRTIEDRRGKQIGRLGVIRDVTEQVRLEELKVSEETLKVALEKERELNQLKTKMMIRIAHEFRTPLSVIGLTGEMLDKYLDQLSEVQRRQKIDEILHRIQHLTQILDDITRIVQSEFGAPDGTQSIFKVGDLCNACVETVRDQPGSHAIIDAHVQMPHQLIRADRRGIETALTELLINAAKYSPEGTPVQFDSRFDGDDLVLQVSDQGVGIGEEDAGRIFEPFYRGGNADDVAGLGLGLSIVRDYVEQQRGDISVASDLGKGSTFTIRLPKVACRDIL